MRIKKGDQVIVRTGRDKGKIGEIMKLMGPKALVKGVNLSLIHISEPTRPS